MRPRSLLSLAVAAAVAPVSSSSLFAQTPVPATPTVRVVGGAVAVPLSTLQGQQDPKAAPQAQPQPGQDPAAPAAAVDPKAAAAATERQQKFQQLQWDRRPSTVLKVWSLPELKPYDPSEEKDKKEGEAAAPPVPDAGAPPEGGEMQIEMSGEVPPEVLQRMVMEQLGAETGGEATPPPPGGGPPRGRAPRLGGPPD